MKAALIVFAGMIGMVVFAQAQTTPGDSAKYWPQWRGPVGTGVAPDADPPVEWSEEKNVLWKVRIPGLGSSSPVIWGEVVYLTTAVETDRAGDTPAQTEQGGGRRGRGFVKPPPTNIHEFYVYAVNRKDGSVRWRTKVKEAVPHEGGHRTATQASNSPICDGEFVYAHFGSRGLYCLDLNGKIVWSKDFGWMRTAMAFGEGSSPALYGDTLVVNWDHEGDSFVVALQKRTGEELWRKERDEKTSWSTPLITPVDGKPQAIISATGASRGYDLKTGEVIWSCAGQTRNCIPTPIYNDGVVYLMSGFRGSMLQAIRLSGAKGKLDDSERLLWMHDKGTSYTPSALLYDGFLYYLRTNSAILTCVDAATGKAHYQGQRLGMSDVYSSPVGAKGRVYVTSRDGMTKVLKLGAEFEVLATNQLDDGFDASPAIIGNQMYLRGREHLYCIAEKQPR